MVEATAIVELSRGKPETATPFYKPTSQADFVAALQRCLDDGTTLMLDPSTRLACGPMAFTLRGTNLPAGLWAYGAQFEWVMDGTWDKTMFAFATDGHENRGFRLHGLTINGDPSGGAQASPDRLVSITATSGAAIQGFHIADLAWYGGCHGLWLEGEVFEGYVTQPSGAWTRHAGIVCRHGHDIPGVMSNIYILAPNITRCPQNMGSAIGILLDRCSSVLIDNGNFISLDGPAIKATNGAKRISNCDFENTGNTNGAAIEIDTTDFWSQVLACEGSNTSGAMRYLLHHGGDPARLDVTDCRMYDGEILRP